MDSKFTKGEWVLANNDMGYYTSVRNKENTRKICVSRVNNQDENNANLLLISKAPKMLEMLERINRELEEGYNIRSSMQQEIKQLVTEATQI